MSSNITRVAVIGTGVIGTGWIIRALAHNKKVTAFDKDIKLKKKLIKEIKRTWPYVKKLFNKKKLNLDKSKQLMGQDQFEDKLEQNEELAELRADTSLAKQQMSNEVKIYSDRMKRKDVKTLKGPRR